jgi:hypothetical protein
VNPFDLSASDLLVWGIVLHLIADWPLQNDWMANNKALRRTRSANGRWLLWNPIPSVWWDRHPASYVHAGIHGLLLALVFGWAAAPLALAHLVIDCRWPVARWSRLMRQTQPANPPILDIRQDTHVYLDNPPAYVAVDVGMEVRFWTDQVFHIACIAVAALAVAA